MKEGNSLKLVACDERIKSVGWYKAGWEGWYKECGSFKWLRFFDELEHNIKNLQIIIKSITFKLKILNN